MAKLIPIPFRDVNSCWIDAFYVRSLRTSCVLDLLHKIFHTTVCGLNIKDYPQIVSQNWLLGSWV